MTTRALAIVFTFVLLLLVPPHAIQAETHQTVPSANFSFMSDLQTFLRNEDANRMADIRSSIVIAGGIHATAAGLVGSPTALLAYLGGYYITESNSITYPDASTCWVIAHKDTTGNKGSYTRVSGTHYLLNCASATAPPELPDTTSALLMSVTTSGGAITAVVDRRPIGQLYGVDACQYTTLNAAITAHGSNPAPLLVGCYLRVTANSTLPDTTSLRVIGTGKVCPDTGVLFTIDGLIDASPHSIFCTGLGTYAVSSRRTPVVYPEWWGAAPDDATINNTAVQVASDSLINGGRIQFACGTYRFNGLPVTFKSYIELHGSGMQCTVLSNVGTTHLLKFTDSTTGNKEVRFSGVFDMGINGNSLSGNGIIVENAYHVAIDRVRVYGHGGIGITFDSHVNGSTYGQSMFVSRSFLLLNLGGGIRLSGSGNLAVLDRNSINQNGYYGIYADRHKQLIIRDNELADYYYASAVAAHQAIPIVLNGGSAIALVDNSFEANAGNGATANCHIKTGWDGDAQIAALNDTQRLSISYNDFKSTSGAHEGALDHICLNRAQGVELVENFFEKEAGYGYTVNGINLGSDQLTNAGLILRANKWDALNAKFVGVSRPFIFDDVYYDNASLDATTARGARCTDAAQIMVWNRYNTDIYDNWELLCDGTIKAGAGTSAPSALLDKNTLTLQSTAFANLGSPSNGTVKYCADCTFANPCAGSGTGSIAKRLNGAWRCD